MPLVQVTREGAVVRVSRAEIRRLRKEFAARHCLLFERFVEPSLLESVRRFIDGGQFYRRIDKGIAVESSFRQNAAYNILQFLANDPAFLAFSESLCESGPLGGFDGRIYRFAPGEGHYDSWHDDVQKGHVRRAGLSVNLSGEHYRGGALELRDKKSKKIVSRIFNTGFGNAMLFRIAPGLEHRVTPLHGKAGRTAFAGWFMARQSDFKWSDRGNRKKSRDARASITPNGRFQAPDHAVWQKSSQGRLLLNASTRRCYRLSTSGVEIFDGLRKRSFLSACRSISGRFGAPLERVERDTRRLATALCREGLLEKKP